MQFLYLATVIAILLSSIILFFRRPRQGLLFVLTMIVFSNDSIPWNLTGIPKISTISEIAVVFICFLYFAIFQSERIAALMNSVNGYTGFTVLFLIQMIVFLPISNALQYGVFKVEVFTVQGFLPILAYAALSPYIESDLKIFIWAVGLGAWLMAIKIFTYGSIVSVSEAHSLVNPDVIDFGRTIGYGLAILLFIYFFRYSLPIWRQTLLLAAIGILAVSILLVGERGPVVAVLISFLVTSFLALKKKYSYFMFFYKSGFLVLLMSVVAIGLNWMHFAGERSLRILNFLSQFPGQGTNPNSPDRLLRFNSAWHAFIQSRGLGIGTGDFSVFYGSAIYDYPHNLFLEILSEQGLIGIAIFTGLLFMVFNQFLNFNRLGKWTFHLQVLVLLWIYSFVNAQVSGDIGANATLWTLGAMFWMVGNPAMASVKFGPSDIEPRPWEE